MKTVSIDFDGVIHAYSKGWADGSCYDVPMPGAIAGIRTLLNFYAVFILSTRDPNQIIEWLRKHAPEVPCGLVADGEKFWNQRGVVGVTNRKLPAMVYIDDRAFLFKSWDETMKSSSDFALWPNPPMSP